MLEATALLATSLLFGGMTLFSAGFAALLFKLMPSDKARTVLRGSFPYYYAATIAMAAGAAALALAVNIEAAMALAAIMLTTLYARQILMAQINAATDTGDTSRFHRLHGASVALQLAQIGVAGWAVIALS